MFEDSVILHRAMQTGAMGYISKSSSPEILISAIKVVAKGQKYIERGLAVNLANQLLQLARFRNKKRALSPAKMDVKYVY